MKKKVLAITMAALMAASLTACGGKKEAETIRIGVVRGYHGSREQG